MSLRALIDTHPRPVVVSAVYIAASLLETDWINALCRNHPDAEFIFIVEGVLMYFYGEQVKK